ncbi:MAG: sugar nucleotide-binding protein [Gammaproteobacteria bacterium]|nr:sugar nucleotide-binding protein [Gammaproteobacteria bacterium]MDH3467287.1 sugar nucleotide-binding protein [Gammaproteobacteria bacterium]
MKIIIVGANGAVGKTDVDALSSRREIVAVGRSGGDAQADIEDIDSIHAMYRQVGKVDVVLSAVGHGHFGKVHKITGE